MQKYKLCLYDLDYTLFETFAKIKLITNGEFEKFFYSSVDYYDHLRNHKKDHHEYDFSEYTCSETFKSRATPIPRVIDSLITDLEDDNSRVVILTARNTFNDMETIYKIFEDHGMDSNKIYYEFAGDVRDAIGRDKISGSEAKKLIAKTWLNLGLFESVKFYDDLPENLEAIGSLSEIFPDIDFTLFHVDHSKESLTINTL